MNDFYYFLSLSAKNTNICKLQKSPLNIEKFVQLQFYVPVHIYAGIISTLSPFFKIFKPAMKAV